MYRSCVGDGGEVQPGSQGAVSVTSMEGAVNNAKTRDPDGDGAFPTGDVEVMIMKSGHVRVITNETAPLAET
jgi:hypothetical protein